MVSTSQLLNLALLAFISLAYAKSTMHISLLNDIAKANVLVVYYSPQCQFSQHFLDMWKNANVQSLPTVGGNLISHLINCKEETDLCVYEGVKYYPSIRFHHVSLGQPQIYRGRRTINGLLSFLGKAMLGAPDVLLNAEAGAEPPVSPPESVDGVMQLTDVNFDVLTARDPVFVKFYTDWCPHCKQIAPVFPQLVPGAKQLGVSLASVNCERQADTCSKQAVPHYPLLALYGSGRQLAVHDGDNSVLEWLQFLHRQLAQLQLARESAASEGIVPNWYQLVKPVSLTWGSFEATAKATDFVFVKFFAPWCSHCQHLAPVWERLAHELAQEFCGTFVVARVDCTAEGNLCTVQGIKAYPTLLLYRRGQQVDSFRGVRDLAALSSFARAAVSLHGGGIRDEM